MTQLTVVGQQEAVGVVGGGGQPAGDGDGAAGHERAVDVGKVTVLTSRVAARHTVLVAYLESHTYTQTSARTHTHSYVHTHKEHAHTEHVTHTHTHTHTIIIIVITESLVVYLKSHTPTLSPPLPTHTRTRKHAHTRAGARARTHARIHKRTHAHILTQTHTHSLWYGGTTG